MKARRRGRGGGSGGGNGEGGLRGGGVTWRTAPPLTGSRPGEPPSKKKTRKTTTAEHRRWRDGGVASCRQLFSNQIVNLGARAAGCRREEEEKTRGKGARCSLSLKARLKGAASGQEVVGPMEKQRSDGEDPV